MNEIRLLLLSVADETVVESMLTNASDQRWTSDELGKSLSLVLGKAFFIWRGIIEATGEKIKVLQKELQPFDDLWNRKSKVSTEQCLPSSRRQQIQLLLISS